MKEIMTVAKSAQKTLEVRHRIVSTEGSKLITLCVKNPLRLGRRKPYPVGMLGKYELARHPPQFSGDAEENQQGHQ